MSTLETTLTGIAWVNLFFICLSSAAVIWTIVATVIRSRRVEQAHGKAEASRIRSEGMQAVGAYVGLLLIFGLVQIALQVVWIIAETGGAL